MIKISFSDYELQPTAHIGRMADSGTRKGCLLKVEWPGGKVGYSDLFPWPELGDESLAQQKEGIQKGRLSDLAEQSLYFAKLDATARLEGRSLFKGAPRIQNHYLITDLTKTSDRVVGDIKNLGFSKVKVKIGIDLDREFDFLRKTIKGNSWMEFRLDCNGKMTFAEFEKFFSKFTPSERSKIEFIEDPCPYDPLTWFELNRVVPIAIDNEIKKVNFKLLEKSTLPFKFVVIKPARFSFETVKNYIEPLDLKILATSSLDHTLGVLSALYIAGEMKTQIPGCLVECGCWSLKAYKPDEFSEKIKVSNSTIQPLVQEPGWGFQAQLEGLPWTPLR